VVVNQKGNAKHQLPKVQTKEERQKKKKTEDEEEDEDEDEGGDGDDGGDGDVVYLEKDEKFWECTRTGKSVKSRWGKIGKDGQSDSKKFPTVEKAQKYAEKKQNEKEKKGYEVASKKGGSKKGSKKATTKGKRKGASEKESKKSSTKGSKKKASKKGGGGGGKTYLEMDSSSGGKFWEVEVSGTDVITRYGRVGSDGATSTKSFASEEKAEKEAAKLIRQKKSKGYS